MTDQLLPSGFYCIENKQNGKINREGITNLLQTSVVAAQSGATVRFH